MKLGKGTLFALALTATAPVYGEATVYVTATAEDSVGGRLVYEVREQLGRSSLMDLASSETGAGYVIRIVTMENVKGASAAYSWVLTTEAAGGGHHILGHGVAVCGTDRIHECAEDLVAYTDEQRASFVDLFTRMLPSPRPTGFVPK